MMPSKIAILYPSVAMALLSLGLIFALGMRRFYAVRGRAMNPKFYRTFDHGEGEPERLRQHTRNVQNQFEVPPLFHLAVWGTYLAGEVSIATVTAAWVFFVSRCVHTFIHLTYNTVIHRFMVYGVGLVSTLYLWLQLLGALAYA
jgi:hypothetical protein